jgi:DNA-binding GntR family transcriptional regulator
VTETLMVRGYELGVPALEEADVAEMRRRLDGAVADAAAGDLIAVLAGVHAMHAVVYAATGNPEFARALRTITPRFDRVLYLWYTDSIVAVGSSYRRDMVEALERGRRDEAVEIVRAAWRRVHDIVGAREEDAAA